jgi:TonB family protein
MKRAAMVAILRFLLPAALIAPLAAQDVTVSQESWVHQDDPPDQFPVPKHRLRPEFPDELRKATDYGYVTEEVFVDDRGKVLSAEVHSTIHLYERDLHLQEGTQNGADSWKFNPATRAGKPVNSLIHFSIVFNPASAGAAGPDAIPRLLDAQAVVDPRRAPMEGGAPAEQEVVWAFVSLDEKGTPTAVTGAPEKVAGLIEKSVKTWRFEPARRAGIAVAQDVRVPFILVSPVNHFGKNAMPPRVIRQVSPVYPASMRRSRMRGEVLVEFTVDIEGKVRRPFVVRSLNPAFDAPAIESVAAWVFEPGRVNGVPVYTHLQVPIFFAMNDTVDGGYDGIDVTRTGDRSRIPDELRVDVEPKILGVVRPVYPYELLSTDVHGSSEVSFLVDKQGRVARSRVIKADRPEFGLALQAAVERFEYEAALKNGRPNEAVIGFRQDFRTSDPNLVTSAEFRLLRLEKKHPERIGTARDLDSPVKPLVTRSPRFPLALLGKETRGDALVEFLVDEDGRPRLPRVVSASNPAFGFSAVQAVVLWQFRPPTSKGKPVVIRVQVPFEFKPGDAEAAGMGPK